MEFVTEGHKFISVLQYLVFTPLLLYKLHNLSAGTSVHRGEQNSYEFHDHTAVH